MAAYVYQVNLTSSRLHIGLETVFGEILPVANLSDIVGIGQFILNRFLSNPDILAQFAHPTGICKQNSLLC